MRRYVAAFAMTAAWACTGVRPADPPAAAGSIAPRLSACCDRVVLSWVERDASGVPTLKFAVGGVLLAVAAHANTSLAELSSPLTRSLEELLNTITVPSPLISG